MTEYPSPSRRLSERHSQRPQLCFPRLLDACDEVGVYVMDEAFDVWYDHTTERDDADDFEQIWRDEVTSMARKDRLHPSVLMYSVGNENSEAFSPRRAAQAMVSQLRALDPIPAGQNRGQHGCGRIRRTTQRLQQ